jgi:Flp pilus assembly pilin Flp
MGRTIMNRWVVRHWIAAGTWLRDRTERAAARYSAASANSADRGQTSFEYLGIAVVIAVIIGVLATTDIGTAVKDAITSTINKITSGGGK